MINCIIIDDDLVSVNLIKHFIANTSGLTLLDSFLDPIAGSNYIQKNPGTIDLIFLDIEMPGMTGIDFMKAHKDLPPVILITAKEKYAVEAFEHKVIHYLVKPIDYGKFLKAIDRVFHLYEAQSANDTSPNLEYIFIKDEGLLSKVMQNDIMYCEALGDYVKVHLKEKTHVVYSTMKNLEDKLKKNHQFVRVHRSYIINLNFLENFDSQTSVVGGRLIPLGDKYKTELQAKLNII